MERELEKRTHVVAGPVPQAEKAAEARALERLDQLELELHRAAVADRDSAVAIGKKPHADLLATRKERGTAEPSAHTEACFRRRAEPYARCEADQVAAVRAKS